MEWPSPDRAPGSHLGFALAAIGDLDRDGTDDLAIGAPCLASDEEPGYVLLVSGSKGAVLARIDGEGAGGHFGVRVCGPGDLDGDARPDLVVVSGGSPEGSAARQPGRLAAYSGATLQELWHLESTGGVLGWQVVGLGDVDGDRRPDLAVTDVREVPGLGREPHVLVLDGSSGELLRESVGTPDDGLGYSLCATPDVDGDRVGELAVGSLSEGKGSVAILSGASGLELGRIGDDPDQDAQGQTLACGGDLDGDGRPEIALGLGNYYNPPQDLALRRLVGLEPWMLLKHERGFWPGRIVTFVPDQDGDGRAELVCGGGRELRLVSWNGGDFEVRRTFASDDRGWFGRALAVLGGQRTALAIDASWRQGNPVEGKDAVHWVVRALELDGTPRFTVTGD